MSQTLGKTSYPRKTAWLLSSALLAQLLVACGGDTATSTPVAAPTTAATSAATSAVTTAPTTAATTAPVSAATDTPAMAADDMVVNMLWTDSSNLRQPLIADFTK